LGAEGVADDTLTAVVLAAGEGRRFGGPSKVWRLLDGRPLWWWSLEAFGDLAAAGVLVVAPSRLEEARELLGVWSRRGGFPVTVVAGGAERWESSRAGVAEVRTGYCAIHDAARPCVTGALVARVFAAARSTGAAVPVVTPADTVKVVADGRVVGTVPRIRAGLAQTPQIFRTDWIRRALTTEVEGTVTDDAELLERRGLPVTAVPGDPENRKITVPEDWLWLERHWAARHPGGGPDADRAGT
jgi:2-C-methyl-D-erythritol 4-phosphate cytidylyltransferase